MNKAEKRIQDDIDFFEKNLKKITIHTIDKTSKDIVKLAKQYCEDAKYYLSKKDHLTAFGCINYAHGLLDAVIKSIKH
jgi:hypothetical protein